MSGITSVETDQAPSSELEEFSALEVGEEVPEDELLSDPLLSFGARYGHDLVKNHHTGEPVTINEALIVCPQIAAMLTGLGKAGVTHEVMRALFEDIVLEEKEEKETAEEETAAEADDLKEQSEKKYHLSLPKFVASAEPKEENKTPQNPQPISVEPEYPPDVSDYYAKYSQAQPEKPIINNNFFVDHSNIEVPEVSKVVTVKAPPSRPPDISFNIEYPTEPLVVQESQELETFSVPELRQSDTPEPEEVLPEKEHVTYMPEFEFPIPKSELPDVTYDVPAAAIEIMATRPVSPAEEIRDTVDQIVELGSEDISNFALAYEEVATEVQLEIKLPETPELDTPILELEMVIADVVSRVEILNEEDTDAIQFILDDINLLISEIEPRADIEAMLADPEVKELRALFSELLDSLDIEYSPALLDSLVKLALIGEMGDLLGTQDHENQEEQSLATQGIGTHEVIKHLMTGVTRMKLLAIRAYQIGRSVLQIYFLQPKPES